MPSLTVLEGPNRGAVIRLLPAPLRLGRGSENELALPDEGVSRVHAELAPREDGRFVARDLGSKNGTFVNGVRLEAPHVLEGEDELRVGDTVLVFGDEDAAPGEPTATVVGASASAPRAARPSRRPLDRASYLVGESAALRTISAVIARVAPLETTVLITGESGTGKELVAEALHRLSRRTGPFVAVNAALLEPALLESELFGHERGSFTGAVARRTGKLEIARGGTLFLDELAELKLDAQAKLLRAIEKREFERLGGSERIATDARFVAATSRDLGALVREGRFREDLLFRLKVVEIAIPPLRDRPDDLAPLIEHFLKELRARIPARARAFSPEAIARLRAYRFPGNVRELRNLVERCLIFADGELVTERDLPPDAAPAAARAPTAIATLEEVEREHLARALAQEGGNKTRVAKLLGIDRATLYAKIKRHGLDA